MTKFDKYNLALKRVQLVMSGEVFLMFTIPLTEEEMKEEILQYKLKVINEYAEAKNDYLGNLGIDVEYYTKLAYTGELLPKQKEVIGVVIG